jgi:hypothetical protein
MKKVHLIFLTIGLLLGLGIGRLIPPAQPSNWKQIEKGMHFEEVYQTVPDLRHSMRDIKGFDTCSAKSGNRYWQILVYYDQKGRVSKLEKRFHWL